MHSLPPLPYPYNALEPYIDEQTMHLHHEKHHQGYIDKLNAALEKYPELQKKSAEDLISGLSSIPDDIRLAVRNHGGGHLNHSWFWLMMAPKTDGKPSGDLAKAIDEQFGSFEKFQASFKDAAITQFGSGWAWLCVDKSGKLVVTKTPNQDNPLTEDLRPILGIDVWEHAYYLKYQNRRPDYIDAWWNVVNWAQVGKNYYR